VIVIRESVLCRVGGDDQVIITNAGPGVPYAVKVEGHFKCIACEEMTSDSLICRDCQAGIKAARSLTRSDMGKVLDNPRLLALLELLAKEVTEEWMREKLREVTR
jgi:hypothetical protein